MHEYQEISCYWKLKLITFESGNILFLPIVWDLETFAVVWNCLKIWGSLINSLSLVTACKVSQAIGWTPGWNLKWNHTQCQGISIQLQWISSAWILVMCSNTAENLSKQSIPECPPINCYQEYQGQRSLLLTSKYIAAQDQLTLSLGRAPKDRRICFLQNSCWGKRWEIASERILKESRWSRKDREEQARQDPDEGLGRTHGGRLEGCCQCGKPDSSSSRGGWSRGR